MQCGNHCVLSIGFTMFIFNVPTDIFGYKSTICMYPASSTFCISSFCLLWDWLYVNISNLLSCDGFSILLIVTLKIKTGILKV